jgi:thiol-disulfide isomerase/thioredoxin
MKTKNYKTGIKLLILAVLVCPIISNTGFAQIKFESATLTEIKAKAKKENKLIFIDCYTTWCGPCKWLAKNVFTNDTVAQFYNANFINASFDMEKGEGLEMAKQYSINLYPSLLFIDANGEIVHRGAGARPAPQIIQLGKDALNPEKQFASLEKKYKGGERDPKFLLSYIAALDAIAVNAKEPLATYFETQKEEDLTNRQNWDVICKYLSDDYQSKAFNYLLKNTDAFSKKYTVDSVNTKIFNVYSYACNELIYSHKADTAYYVVLKEKIKNSNFARTEELLLSTDMSYYRKKNDYANYAITAVAYLDKYNKKDPRQLNDIAYTFYQKVKEKDMLAKAEVWGKQLCEIKPNEPGLMDTYACLLFVNGKKQDAVKLEKQALDIINVNPDHDKAESAEFETKIKEWSK